jgi:hypothetical protein
MRYKRITLALIIWKTFYNYVMFFGEFALNLAWIWLAWQLWTGNLKLVSG